MKNNDPYYIGIDAGTSSVGFAVTDTEYNILKFKGKSMWGSHLFDEAHTAAERRMNRCARRRLERRKERIRLAQAIFAEKIAEVDPLFFIRLNDSGYVESDKREQQRNSLFNDSKFTDKDFFKKYPTIYHLRLALINNEAEHDPRLLYLAVHHILKNRGHFLLPGENLSAVNDISSILKDITDLAELTLEITINFPSVKETEAILQVRKRSERKELLLKGLTSDDEKRKKKLCDAIVGNKVKVKDLFVNEEYEELPAIEFKNTSFEETILPELEAGLDDDEYQLILRLKALYDWSLLSFVLSGKVYISDAKVALFEKNKADLKLLKELVKEFKPEEYEEFFHGNDPKNPDKGLFSNYIGNIHDDHKSTRVKRCSEDDFYKKVKSLLLSNSFDKRVDKVLSDIEDGNFLPLLSSYRNGVVPYQVHKTELEVILGNASVYFPWLNEKDGDGYSPKEKLLQLLTFRIPYYVGPLGKSDKAVNSWMVRKSEGKIYPWNFDLMVDEAKSAEGFIRRMTNKCTYLPTEDVLPKNSLLYSKYMVLNELNNLRLNGDKLSSEQKQQVYMDLFRKQKKVTIKKLKTFAVNNGWFKKGEEITVEGIDNEFKASLVSYNDFAPWLESGQLKISDIEQIIRWLTIFSDGGRILRNNLTAEYGNILTKEDIKRISALRYSGWGRFSEKFLAGIYAVNKSTGEQMSIISWLWETQNNLMEILSGNFEISTELGDKSEITKLDYSVVEKLYVSPSVKRQIWQTLRIVDELEHVMGHKPAKVFVETTRHAEEKKRKKSRKETLLEIYKKNPSLLDKVISEIENTPEDLISKRDRLYLYLVQNGKCMYSGETINLEELFNAKKYDIDHIYPFSKSADDSLSNRVLVKTECNEKKSDNYPIEDSIRSKQLAVWKNMKDAGLINSEKYYRLTRNTPLTEDELNGFINRQLVETSQSTKATIEILQRYFGPETQVVYSKAINVSDFRKEYGFVKCRSINDLHHAKDAYLNIVVGNVYHTKYTKNFWKKADNSGYFNLSKAFKYNVKGAWVADPDTGTIKTVKKTMNRNNILLTHSTSCKKGKLFDLTIASGGTDSELLPRKSNDQILQLRIAEHPEHQDEVVRDWTKKYGGYNKLGVSHFALVKHQYKGKLSASFIPIRIVDKDKYASVDRLKEYCTTKLELKAVEVVLPVVKINTHLEINGYSLLLTGTSTGGSAILVSNHVPLIVSKYSESYLKNIEKYYRLKKTDKNYVLIPELFGFDFESNLRVYNELIEKSASRIFCKRPANQSVIFLQNRDIFESLSLENQLILIMNIVAYFNNNGLCDLSLISGSSHAGLLKHNAKFDLSKESLQIVNQSITGLYETRIDIK